MRGAVPRVSVLLPVRDGAAFLEEALASILLPDRDFPLELLAIDDGSRDASPAILARAAARDPRLRVITTEPRGIVAALNLALARARAEVIARMDADDRSLPGRIEALLGYLEANPGVAAAGTGLALHPRGLLGLGMRRYAAWLNAIGSDDIAREIWVESPLAHPTLGARRSVLLSAGGYREGPFAEDYELLLRLHAKGLRLAKLAAVLYWWRDHERTLTRTDPRYAPAAFRALKASYLRAGPLASSPRVAVWGAGKTGRPFARALRAVGLAVTAWIEVDPRQVGRVLHGAPVLPIEHVDRLRGEVPIVVAVGAPGARALIRGELARRGFEELRDYFVVA